jgi:hypothetical protein
MNKNGGFSVPARNCYVQRLLIAVGDKTTLMSDAT